MCGAKLLLFPRKLRVCFLLFRGVLLYPHSSAPPQRPKHSAQPSLQKNSCLFGAALCSLLPSITTLTGSQTYKVITKLWQQIHDIFLAGQKGQLLFFYQVFSFLFQLISQAKPSSCFNPDPTPSQLVCAYITTAKGQMSCS